MGNSSQWQGVVERLAWGGLGIGRLDDGRVILLDAPLALFPGELVEAELEHKPRHAEGKVTRWLKPSEARTESGCRVGDSCGGCSLWEAGASVAELKQQMVIDLLHRQFGDAREFNWLSAPPTALRGRIQLHWDGVRLGFHRRRTNDVIAIDNCPLASSPVSAAVPALRSALENGELNTEPDRWELACGTPAEAIVAVAGSQPDQPWLLDSDSWVATGEPLAHQLGSSRLIQPPGSFFQACPGWAWDAFSIVFNGWGIGGQTLYDLYGGVGFFSVMLKDNFERFVVVEFSELSCNAARANLATSLVDSTATTEVHQTGLAEWLPEELGEADDLILLDPPRAGLPKSVARPLQDASAETMVLIGCDGMAFCRDVSRLAPAWQLEQLSAIDLFPNTSAVEFVGLLRHR